MKLKLFQDISTFQQKITFQKVGVAQHQSMGSRGTLES